MFGKQNGEEFDYGTTANTIPWTLLRNPVSPAPFAAEGLVSHLGPETLWPQVYSQAPFETTRDQSFFDSIDNNPDPRNGSFGDAEFWEEWDQGEDLGVAVARPPWLGSAEGIFKTTFSSSDPSPKILDSYVSIYTDVSGANSSRMKNSVRPVPKTAPSSSSNGFAEPFSSVSSTWNHEESILAGADVFNAPKTDFGMRQDPGMARTTRPSAHAKISSSPSTFTSSATPSSFGFSPTRDQRALQIDLEGADSREGFGSIQRPQLTTERKYRSSVGDGYFDLLKALPDELPPKKDFSLTDEKREKKNLSKAEVLSFAVTHIKHLEERNRTLRNENLLLTGQVSLFENWIGQCECK